MIPLPTTPITLKKGTKVNSKAGLTYILQVDCEWDGKSLGAYAAASEITGTVYAGGADEGDWASYYETADYPWRELDRNDDSILWECVAEGDYYQSVRPIGCPRNPWKKEAHSKEWRAELGQTGWKVISDGRVSLKYVPRAPTPQPAPAPPVIPDPPPPAPEPKRQWPTRSAHVAQLAMEMSVPLADRMLKVKR